MHVWDVRRITHIWSARPGEPGDEAIIHVHCVHEAHLSTLSGLHPHQHFTLSTGLDMVVFTCGENYIRNTH